MLGATQKQLFNTKEVGATPGAGYPEPPAEDVVAHAAWQAAGGAGTPGSTEITSVKPYVPYSENPADYVAGFSPLQQQSFTTTLASQ